MEESASILFVAPSAYCLGGVQVWLEQIVANLPAVSPWKVQVALPSGNHHNLKRYIEAYPNLPIVAFSNPTGSAEGRRKSICQMLLNEQPDLVVGVNIGDLYQAARRARAKGFQGKVVLSLHALAADLLADIKHEADFLDAVVATNQLSRQLVHSIANIPPERIFYAPYGIDEYPYNSAKQHDTELKIAWVGRLEEDQKRVHDLPEILTELDKINLRYKLTIAGDGPEKSSLTKLLQPWISSGKAMLAGALSGHELAEEVYATHDALLITSRWETGPIVAWEAMMAGLVVVTSAYVGSGAEGSLMPDENCLMFPIGDAAKAAAAIAKLADASLYERISRAGYVLVNKRYTKSLSLEAWRQAFAQILSLPPRGLAQSEQPPMPSGRLDQLLGTRLAELVRQRLGIRFVHQTPGGEWPHSCHGDCNEESLLIKAAEVDAPS
jgi:glycosyltransferase involved in cell wall biosynthesis